MEKSRRSFFKKGLAGAILLGTASVAKAGLPDPVKPKAAKAVNPFHLGMAGYTFVNFDLETTLKTLSVWIFIIFVSRIFTCRWIAMTIKSRLSMTNALLMV